mgnify:CR=1 FL=1
MKALTLTQPYATLVALGAKQIETRGQRLSHRGPLAIHAGLGPGYFGSEAALWDCCLSPPFAHVLREAGLPSPARLPRGAIVAIVNVTGCRIIGREPNGDATIMADDLSFIPILGDELAFGDYSPGRYAWLLADVRALAEPIAARGMQGLWEWTPPEGVEVPV